LAAEVLPDNSVTGNRSESQAEEEKEKIVSLYRRGCIWWYEFQFQGALIRETTGLTNKDAARGIEINRKHELRTARAGIKERVRIPIFSLAAEQWLTSRKPDWSAKMYVIESTNIKHLTPTFGKRLLTDISGDDVCTYRADRLEHGAAPKTVSLELGSLRALLRHYDLDSTWTRIKKKIRFDKGRKLGRCISTAEESALLSQCRNRRSRSLYPAVVIALQACLRYSEIRQLRWQQVDLGRSAITVGKSKTDAGEGRVIPMSRFLCEILTLWATRFPSRKLNHFVFPSEKYGQGGKVYAIDVTRPIGTFKYAWRDARKRAGVQCRFHDLRHTGCTRLLDAGVPHPVVAEIMGWSTSTAIRMIKEVYGHVSLETRKRAIEQVDAFMQAQILAESAQNSAQSQGKENVTIQ
jgi:integrase